MKNYQLKTPVVFIIFNRPETTKKVFEKIREAKPPKLFVIADGPRRDNPEDKEKCAATREIIAKVDWNCEILKNYSDINLGCGKRISSGLNWVFENVEEAIILEDDCLPDSTFFRFCEELLDKFKGNEKIISISGLSVPQKFQEANHSYTFTNYFRCWGWATWKRAWQCFDFDMKDWPYFKNSNNLRRILKNKNPINFWTRTFQSCYEGKINSWAYKFLFSCWLKKGINIIPNTNLIENIGFGLVATNTTNVNLLKKLNSKAIEFPLKHPQLILANTRADEYIQKTRHSQNPVQILLWRLTNLLLGKR